VLQQNGKDLEMPLNTELISFEEAASKLGLSPWTLRLWARQRRIASVKLGGRRLLQTAEMERLVQANLTPALPQATAE
jgi:excisionase family DNA binding protein